MEGHAITGAPPQDAAAGGAAPEGLDPGALAFVMELGVCPGLACPLSLEGCDPRCPALREWVQDVPGG